MLFSRKVVTSAILFLSTFVLVAATHYAFQNTLSGDISSKSMKRLHAALGAVQRPIDPTNIKYTGNWYLISHTGEMLLRFDHTLNRFIPSLAESWVEEGMKFSFRLREGTRFHDGVPLTASDVAASIKNQIIKKTSTHFPVWEYFEGCEQLTEVSEDCPGIRVISETEIEFELKQHVQSFLLFLSSPEGSIWREEDLREDRISSFSGPYFVRGEDETTISLAKNPHSMLISKFLEAPDEITIQTRYSADVEEFLKSGGADIFITSVRPFTPEKWSDFGYRAHSFNPSTIIYFLKLAPSEARLTSRFFEALWESKGEDRLTAADSFLPFSSVSEIDRKRYLELLPDRYSGEIRVATVSPYFRDEFHELLKKQAETSGLKLTLEVLDAKGWIAAMEDRSKYDFIISSYVASERLPSVQLRYMAKHHSIPWDISEIDTAADTFDRKEQLRRTQTWMIDTQAVLPLFFMRSDIVYRPELDIGAQPISDVDIQLWRVKWRQ